jgi:acyl transferase domain-containing protein/acyl carrier protein
MEDTAYRAIAIVAVGAILPDAPNVATFWENVKQGRYSITEVDPERWDPALYYDPDHAAPEKAYSKIGGWVREYPWDPMKWRLPVPPRVVNAMDDAQKWGIACTKEALEDYGYPQRPLDLERTAVILGNAMAGEKHYLTSMRAYFPEYARELEKSSSFAALPEATRREITRELHQRLMRRLPEITEDSMPGELANCLAGRIANLFNFRGANYTCDAACASTMAAIISAAEGLIANHFDVAISGGIDRNMGAPTFIKFCKIGALSATGTRPYAEGADGFVMGEGAALFVLKRLADAERDGDKIYAVLRGIAGSSDGKGKGITAPNPVGQKLCVERAWKNAGLSPASATFFEGHGTSTKVGDVVEVNCLNEVLSGFNVKPSSIALGSVKSNIGHLKGAASAAAWLKVAMALHDKVLPPSVNFKRPNPDIDFVHSPLYVNTELKPWEAGDNLRRAGVSAFGFGGTNFHAVLEEYVPGMIKSNGHRSVAVHMPAITHSETTAQASPSIRSSATNSAGKAPLRGAMVIGGNSAGELVKRLREVIQNPPDCAPALPLQSDLRAPERIAIDYTDAPELADKVGKAVKACELNQPAVWKALRAQGIFRGHGPAPKVAFLYTGQGSQYVNMLKQLRAIEPVVAEIFAEADRVTTPLLGKPLSEFIFVDESNAVAVAKAEDDLRQTAITQPAVQSVTLAMTRLLGAYGIRPDMTMGHSVGEYAALVAAGALPFEDAMEAVSARGREMTRVAVKDNGHMAAIFAPLPEIERILKTVKGYVVIANINSENQAVIGGTSDAVDRACEVFLQAGFNAVPLPVSHAFHTEIVAPASEPLRRMLTRLRLSSPKLPVVANLTGEFYPTGPDVAPRMVDILARQVAAPVQFVKGLKTLYEAGARVFIETGPKKALHGFVDSVLGDRPDVLPLFTNHPKVGDVVAFNQALCGLYAAGLGQGAGESKPAVANVSGADVQPPSEIRVSSAPAHSISPVAQESASVVITGAALGLPGTPRIFDDGNISRILNGQQFIRPIPPSFRQAMLDKNITRLVKSDNGGPVFEAITDVADVIKLAGRGGEFDLAREFGVPSDRISALDRTTRLAIAVGLDALRDAGVPLVMRYKTTTKGTKLPERWGLPDALRDETGVIFSSAFPGLDQFAEILSGYHKDRGIREKLAILEDLRAQLDSRNGSAALAQKIDRTISELGEVLEKERFSFDRRFVFRVLAMGHSQFAELIGARGPNTQNNCACASTPQAISLAHDWISTGRCRRVVVISADDVTSNNLMEWMGAGFVATGAAATDEVVEDAAIPFDRRRHGMILGMGAAAIVLERADAARERGLAPICEVLGTITANSAFHGTRLDVQHIGQLMEDLIAKAEASCGISRHQIAPHTVFVSHETYTPARGGSASAEINALRRVFGEAADQIVIANTKGFTGHAMGSGIEDVVAIKALETGIVPPVPNFKEVDPELGLLNLSRGGAYPVEYALRLGAGFGSQIAFSLVRWVKTQDGVRRNPTDLGYAYRVADTEAWNGWLTRITGYATPDLEVVNRTLRVRDQGASARKVDEAAPAKQAAQASAPIVDKAVAIAERAPAPVEVAVPVAPPKNTIAEASVPMARAAAAVNGTSSTTAVPPAAFAMQTPKIAAPVAVKVDSEPVRAAVSSAVASPKTASGLPDGSVKERILALVSEKTGYPADMLDVDLDLEADLGVDTVKQAEVFATVREAYGIQRDESIKLRNFPTLAHVIRFVEERRSKVSAEKPLSATSAEAPVKSEAHKEAEPKVASGVDASSATAIPISVASTLSGDSVEDSILSLVVEKTGYPMEMLDLDLDLEADLGVDTVKQAELFAAVRGIYNIPRDENLKLRDFPTLAHVIRFVYDKRPDLAGIGEPSMGAANTAASASSGSAAPLEPSVPSTASDATVAAANVGDVRAEVKEKLLDIVAAQTGYPKDMLDLDLDLEADLGIDTVKQAEMFAAVRGAYNIPRDENLKLRDFPTLAHVIRFVLERRPDLAGMSEQQMPTKNSAVPVSPSPVASTPTSASVVPPATPDADALRTEVKEKLLDIIAAQTGYPKDMLDLDLDLEADLGIDTVKQAEMFAAVRGAYNIPRDENLKLRDFPTLAHVIRFVLERRPDLAGVQLPPQTDVTPLSAVIVEAKVASVTNAPPLTVSAGPILENESFSNETAVSEESIRDVVLNIVAEKTGYPKDMLDLDLDLEADLGVDTVKQAEMFAAVRVTYDIPRDENLKLRDFPTLASVIKFARDKIGARDASKVSPAKGLEDLEPARKQAKPASPVTTEAQPVRVRPPVASLDAANRVPRRVPVPEVRPALASCKLTGVKIAPGQRVVVMPDKAGVAEALTKQLQAKGVEVLLIDTSADAVALTASLKNWVAAGPIQGVFWLPALDHEGDLRSMELEAWHSALWLRLKALYTTMRVLYEQIASANAFLITATRLGGQHGYDPAGAVAPLGGAVTGFTKAYKRERPECLVKAVDFATDAKIDEIAGLLIDEALRDPGTIEIGYKAGLRWTVGLQEQPAANGRPGLELDENTVFLITGAAGSIVSAITSDLAAASGGTFYLLDLVPEPDRASPDLKKFVTDKDGLKRELFARLQASGQRATPALVEKELAAIERALAAQNAIDAVRAAGGTPYYFSLDLTDPDATAKVISQVRKRSGRIDVLLHAAGMDRSRFLPEKEPREFDLVFDVKSDGWFNLLRAIGEMPLKATVAFSSIAGRFGNGGQTDYSSANDLLCKIASSFRTLRPGTRAIAIDWTAWAGIGMASRGSIPKMMELAGIEMLAAEAGVPIIRRELTQGGTRGEVVIAQALGALLKEPDPTGGLDTEAVVKEAARMAHGPMIGRVTRAGSYSGLEIEVTLDPAVQPFLYHHRIEGTPVLPGVMGIEAFAEAARWMVPNWHVDAVEEVEFLAPFKFYRNKPRPLNVQVAFRADGDDVRADCRLIGRRELAHQSQVQETVHFIARLKLAKQLSAVPSGKAPGAPAGPIISAAEIYSMYFHGPAYQVLKQAWRADGQMIGEMSTCLPANHLPETAPLAIAPRLIELCFQTAGLWELTVQKKFGLPHQVGQIRVFESADPAKQQLYAIVTAKPDLSTFDAEVVDSTGKRYLSLSDYRTVALSDAVDDPKARSAAA